MATTEMDKKNADNPSIALSSFADHPVNKALSKQDKIALYRDMVRIRRFEERSLRAYQQGHIGGFLHLYIGQEAVAVGTISASNKKNDHFITAYRDHGHALMVGMSMNECMAELFGKATGCSKGKGGSMHYFAPDKNFWGGHGIVGGQTPLGAGLAFALKYKGIQGAALCYMGDGAVNQGAFHESLNLAALWDLPVIYIIENNGYSMGTSLKRSSAFRECLAKRAEGYDMEWDRCFGHDVYEVRACTAKALERAYQHSRPTLLEIDTYRYRGHSVADANAEKYRSRDEIEEYKRTKDPINLFQNQLIHEGVLDEAMATEIDNSAREEANNAATFAEQSPHPEISSILEDIYWEEDHPDQKISGGRIFFNDEE
ncbi:MAG: pyruvate dehydrogenase (acetyl-transferring) E1 component subunit alpha [Candidatus Methylacidiphilales bacterium]